MHNGMYMLHLAILQYSIGKVIIGIVIGARYNSGSTSGFVHKCSTSLLEQEVKRSLSQERVTSIKDNKNQES